MNTTTQPETVNVNVKKVYRLGDQQGSLSNPIYTVYKITNLTNDLIYIGVTSLGVERRWKAHLRTRFRKNSPFYIAIRELGKASFSLEVLYETNSIDEARMLEHFCIIEWKSRSNGYNLIRGGSNLCVCPESARLKQIGKVIPLDSRIKMAAAKRGDSRCSKNFGSYTKKGADNPKSGTYLIQFPDGSTHVVRGRRAFCRERGFSPASLVKAGGVQGYRILRTFNDYPLGEYTQASGSGGSPNQG
jgi:GIY-YIG catalytic domain